MHQMLARRIGRERAVEFCVARLGEQIGDAHAGEGSRLLRHQRVERLQDFVGARRVDQLDRAELAQLLALGAVAPAGRRRALGRVEAFPVAGKMREISAARRHAAAQLAHRIGFAADRFRHLLELEKIETQARIVLQAARDVAPQGQKPRTVDARGEARRQERRVVIAQIRAEPGQFARRAGGAHRERQQHQKRPRAVAHGDDGRPHALAGADQALPGREPVEALEHRAVGLRLEGAPVRPDRRQVLMYGNANDRRAPPPRRTRRRPLRGRRSGVEMRVKSCWNSLGHGRVSNWRALECRLGPTGVHIPLTRRHRRKSR